MKISILLMLLVFNLNAMEKVIYGDDDRVEPFDFHDLLVSELSRSSVALFYHKALKPVSGGYRVATRTMADRGLCSDETFFGQLTVAHCTGFLIAPNKVVTAGHCMVKNEDCTSTLFAFDYALSPTSKIGDPMIIAEKNVYKCASYVTSRSAFSSIDYAVVTLDRNVPDRQFFKVRKDGIVNVGDEMTVIGHPWGLPTKIANNGKVLRMSRHFFMTDLDTYGGNSGSPVINSKNLLVEGILTSGNEDYEYDFSTRCFRSKRCSRDNPCEGEGVLKITSAPLVLQIAE